MIIDWVRSRRVCRGVSMPRCVIASLCESLSDVMAVSLAKGENVVLTTDQGCRFAKKSCTHRFTDGWFVKESGWAGRVYIRVGGKGLQKGRQRALLAACLAG